ncbi:pilus assembly protein PilZ [Pseudomonas chlororaphis]|uniref:Pilus assembly protein PilZ n=1 Tax=Pseudomonas chlororaphis TaxID=587753 RepID=A0A0A6DJD5_9PSED|nr:pilus assembly protein PilZ [Pseudomonas chlororaphis]
MSEQRKSLRIKITHDSFGECLGQTRNLSPTGVFVQHPVLASLPKGAVVYGQVQGLPTGAPQVRMEVVTVDADGIGLRYL